MTTDGQINQRINDNRELRNAWRRLTKDERRAVLPLIREADDKQILTALKAVRKGH